MFSDCYNAINKNVRLILQNTGAPSVKETKEILKKSETSSLSLRDIAKLLQIGKSQNSDVQFNLIRSFSNSRFRKNQNVLRYIAPLYLSSFCSNSCNYCNYSSGRKNVSRVRLSEDDLREEVVYLQDLSNDVIELTLASDSEFSAEKLTKYIKSVKNILNNKKGSGVLLCSDYFSKDEYSVLKDAGLFGMVQWDETLDRESYERWHNKGGKKYDFENRINNHDRAIRAGLQVAVGCLFGLSDYRYDVLMQIAKVRYLKKEYGVVPFVFGTPRLKPICGQGLGVKNKVSDRQYELSLRIYKIAEPTIVRWLQTRESMEFNLVNIFDHDICTYQCGGVKPGGYKVNRDILDSSNSGQFKVSEITKKQFEDRLKKMNFSIDYNWI